MLGSEMQLLQKMDGASLLNFTAVGETGHKQVHKQSYFIMVPCMYLFMCSHSPGIEG